LNIDVEGHKIPYPWVVIRGQLRLSGVNPWDVERIVANAVHGLRKRDTVTEDDLVQACRSKIPAKDLAILHSFDVLTEYERLRRERIGPPPVVLALEGASGTGKSLLALTMIFNMAATRIISTDTIRQVLRDFRPKETNPELHCHTYQAYAHRQSGPENLNAVLRGYLAQCELICPQVQKMVQRVVAEGADTVVEGVHILPGDLHNICPSVLEVLVNPAPKVHKEMFITKHLTGKLRTVSENESDRLKEFRAARLIQDYMVECVFKSETEIVGFTDYRQAEDAICQLVVAKIESLVEDFKA
jgi:2-phosphoglycerate kinase